MKKLIISILVTLVLVATMVPVITAGAQGTGLLDHVVISPASATIPVSGTQQFTAVGQDASDQPVSDVSFAWSVAAGGGTISDAGLFTAGTVAGTFTNTVLVTAVKGDVTKTANATVTVATPGLLDHVVISPATATIPVSSTQQFTAAGQDAFNQPVSDVTFTWSVAAGGGTISDTGLFTAGTVAGTFTNTVLVTAVKGDVTKTANATVTITSIPDGRESRTPPGWSKGKKTGWHGADTPPGWSKGKKTGWNRE